MDPARMFKESLTSRPELENSQGHRLPPLGHACVSKRQLKAFDIFGLPKSGYKVGHLESGIESQALTAKPASFRDVSRHCRSRR
ncbi:hypothetical protein SAMN05216338_10381 [Bradyrhizobium sp. Rc2d]|nr:hypothetical protein SAMN05216338_10381 [Bradyrhizobium sp. Rc2d]